MTSLVPEMFKQTCRTCLNTKGEMVPIFSSDFYVNQLPKKLMAFTEVEISDDDNLPKVICKKCMFMADSFYCFKEQCESADNQLKLLIRRNSNRDNSLMEEKQVDLDSTSNKTVISNIKNLKNEAKNIAERSQEAERNYVVEYISEEVRIEVENALKRRQEVERRISMEKVSESIKNLKGIEVVPIGDVDVTRNARNSRDEKEEIVVFPVNVPKKPCRIIEAIDIDDQPPLNKKFRLPPETTVSKINGGDVKKEDYVVYGKDKKLNFSTVRKVVKIDDEELCVQPKEEENSQIICDTDVLVASNDNNKENAQFRNSKIQIDKEVSEINSEKLRPDVIKVKPQEGPEDGENNFKMQLLQLLDIIPVHNENINHNRNNKLKNVLNESNSTGHEKEPTSCHPTIEEPVKNLVNQESKEMQRCKLTNNSQSRGEIAKSTIGLIINGSEDQNFDDIIQQDDEEGVLNFENVKESFESFSDRRTDKSNEIFIENEVNEISDNCSTANDDKTMKSIRSYSKNCFKTSKINREKAKEYSKVNSIAITGNQRGNSDEVTPLALLSVNSLGEQENRTINLKIYKRNESEGIEGAMEDGSSVKDESLVSYARQNPGNLNRKFYQCTICSINFVSMPTVLRHNIEEHMPDKSPFCCLICDKSFQAKTSLCEHVKEHNGSKPYRCTFCPKTFTLKRNLKRHVNYHINYKPLQCQICTKRFAEKSSLKSHMLLHTGESPFACKNCNVSFNSKTNWRRHVMTVHEKLTVITCKVCNKELPDKRYLRVHMRSHTGDRPYQCPHCEKRFTQQCNLNTHIHCHLNDRPFGCPHCGKGFNQRGTRDDHILTHTGEKPHKCTECNTGFTVLSALKRHMWIHTDKDRPYNCKKCKVQFVGLYDLRRHLKIRHGEIFKPRNPRVERVLGDEEDKKEDDSESQVCLNEDGSTNGVQSCFVVVECRKAEITAKENSSLSCNVNKIEDVRMDDVKESLSGTRIEKFNNVAKEESINNSEVSIGGDETPISGSDIGGH